ncbi:hypothetical protein D3C81_333590 [compost metagenome]
MKYTKKQWAQIKPLKTLIRVTGQEDDHEFFTINLVKKFHTSQFYPKFIHGSTHIYHINLTLQLSNGDTLKIFYECKWPSPDDIYYLQINNNPPINLDIIDHNYADNLLSTYLQNK